MASTNLWLENNSPNALGSKAADYAKSLIVDYIYRKEDLLFKVLYDKVYRPSAFSSIFGPNDEESSSYYEIKYLERASKTRFLLLQKYPMVLSFLISILFTKRLLRLNNTYLTKEVYQYANTPAKR